MKVSVVIVTKNRYHDLQQCLGSLACQSIALDELIIIDNDSSDQTRRVIDNFSRRVNFLVKIFIEKKTGYPIIYNSGLKRATYPWVAFIDDDCVADVRWFETIKMAILRDPDNAAYVGKSKTYFSTNNYSLVTIFFDEFWKQNGRGEDSIIDFETLDNKNIIYNKKFLVENNVFFDESRAHFNFGVSEDCDLGMQIQEKGGKAKYIAKMLVAHKDPTTFSHYYKKLINSSTGHIGYEQKWSKFRHYNVRRNKVRLRNFLLGFTINYNLGRLKSVVLLVNICLTLLVTKSIRFMKRF